MKIEAKSVPRCNGMRGKLFLYLDTVCYERRMVLSYRKEGDVLGEGFRTETLELIYYYGSQNAFHLLSERVSQPNSSYNVLVLVPVIIRVA